MTQAQSWLDGAADAYYERNKKDFGANDPVIPVMRHVNIKPQRVLEVACANGWRLQRIKEEFGSEVYGIEPSAKAIEEANANGVVGSVGIAQNLPYHGNSFDLVILGCFMLWCEPTEWFRIVTEADRVLCMGGTLIVHDYIVPRPLHWLKWAPPEASDAERQMDGWLYDFAKLFTCHPNYQMVAENVTAKKIGQLLVLEGATVIRKINGFAPAINAE